MGGLLHFFDFNQASTSRRLLTNKRYTDGLEAPRNSLELPVEPSQGYHGIHENIPFSCQFKQHPSKMNFYHSGPTMKKLIDEEISKRTNTKCNAPSVVAHLMGMGTLPSEVKPVTHLKESKHESSTNNMVRKEHIENTHYKMISITPFKQRKQKMLSYGLKRVSNQCSKGPRLMKPHHREHPQEELLQKFKKEFEAWQKAKVWECSKAVGLDHNFQRGKDYQIPAEENLNNEKMAHNGITKRNMSHKKPAESIDFDSGVTLEIDMRGRGSHHKEYMSKNSQRSPVEAMSLRNGKRNSSFEQFPIMKFDEKYDSSSSLTRIVILKPSTEKSDDIEKSWPVSSEILEREVSMKDFLEEVKGRLRFEIQGKARNDMMSRGNVSEIPFREMLTDPKQIARHIAKQIRESVLRDFGTTLKRSESTRSYRSEIQLNGPDPPEFINRDTRKLLSERLRNVLQNEADANINTVENGRSSPSVLVEKRPSICFQKLGKNTGYWEDRKNVIELKTGSFRQEQENNLEFGVRDMSPRNLVRSLSAPVSGTALGKLILEDRHVLTGAQIRRKHEVVENISAEVRKNRKDGFNFKGRVSNLRHNLTLRGKLFGKKIQLAADSGEEESDSLMSIVTAASVVLNLGITQENSTEVPPSPASVSNGSHDDFCKPSHPSPVSLLEAHFIEDHSLHVYGEISSNLHELRSLSDPVEIVGSEEISTPQKPYGFETADVEGHKEAYLRDILVTAGLYKAGSLDKILTRWDSATKPIADWVFEEVEEAYSKYGEMDDENSLLDPGDIVTGHKILFDLLNEALPAVLRRDVFVFGSALKRFVTPTSVPHGKKLLDDVWCQIENYMHPTMEGSSSLDTLVAHNLRLTPWMLDKDIDMVGGDIEWIILGEIIDEFVSDMCS